MDEAAHAAIGRTETIEDTASPGPLVRLAALLDHDAPPWHPGTLPPLAHWLYFLPGASQSLIGPDGHPRGTGLLPAMPLPRRMWAGSRVSFLHPIPLGAPIARRSTIESITPKHGKSGEMVFVTILHEIFVADRIAIRESQDIVYREPPVTPRPDTPAPAPHTPPPGRSRPITPDPILLFRFSALTFNSHRIHYDRDYATAAEGYPGLVVHGPLIAMLLMDHYLRHHPAAEVATFGFRSQQPLFDTAPFTLFSQDDARGAMLSAAAQHQPPAMTARLDVAA